jgi:hypothetical protein
MGLPLGAPLGVEVAPGVSRGSPWGAPYPVGVPMGPKEQSNSGFNKNNGLYRLFEVIPKRTPMGSSAAGLRRVLRRVALSRQAGSSGRGQ